LIQTVIRKNLYVDSIFLMNATRAMLKLTAVDDAVVAMGSDMNKTVLAEFGAPAGEIDAATAGDLIIALASRRKEAIGEAQALLDSLLKETKGGGDDGDTPWPT
jgi:hypothetical protein